MDRKQISGNVPADIAEVISDIADDAADALQDENREAAKKNALDWTHCEEFWREVCADAPALNADALADALANLKASIDGDAEATSRIHRALHQIVQQALPEAEKHLLSIYEADV